eukprot:CAMPEP_0176366336 /NCGR_PEP_ID=MMETSP0126-20121128/21112_1 /TAXON_ID=141414 ORGANISM="Strombidinopsis acuminatum, Strain SPMC142" /NCGR_SAMPLE_ID=MMETSP0126 /ASSEMBLY_ACC=CAM_ASM_000229 /LENGTH=61 /DNA_ID=CAMNT_0017723723 /DNA_START=224 /DNA_END=409 /DNA_ORIENTATION=+
MSYVAESKKNMRIDMRPGVLLRTMPLEFVLVTLTLAAVIGMPLYFLKLKDMLYPKEIFIED